MRKKLNNLSIEFLTRSLIWLLIAIYTYLLPQARRVYNAIVALYGDSFTGKIPLVLVIVVAVVYAAAVWLSQKGLRNLVFLIPCALISYLIMIWVENPNKHIHIPQYTLMAWLLYWVLSKDYKSGDIYFLIFIYASMLGVVDELEQGLHPSRFYGWIDMAVNSSSGLIGIFTIMGLRQMQTVDWKWADRLKEAGSLIWLNLFGVAGVVLMCVHLFQVQANEVFWGVYPAWLLAWSVLFLVVSPIVLTLYWRKIRRYSRSIKDPKEISLPSEVKIINLWTIPMLAILFYMHSLLVYLAVSGVEFI